MFKAAREAIAPFDAATSDGNPWSFPFDACGGPRLIGRGRLRHPGPPLLSGRDPDGGYRHAVRRGRTGLLIAQRSDHDCQSGDDINDWVRRWSGSAPKPTSPLIDWPTGQYRP